MKKFSFLCLLTYLLPFGIRAQSADESAVKKVLADQAAAWNLGNIDEYMKGYWQSDSLMYIGHGGVTYGYAEALENYKKNYNSPAKMGKLFFTLIKTQKLSPQYYYVTGKWFLKRKEGDIGGYYTLLFKKIRGRWVIISDHTS
ncbi:MAG TPA: nuclear transport factor 2 family protein [Puia sp.]|nr:nuclear transport factor 2 family protein [Puia sp.]